MRRKINESAAEVQEIEGDFSEIATAHYWTRNVSVGAGGVGIIALVIVMAVICYFCFLARCR